MAFYVPVGSRGVLLRVGNLLNGALGALAYWRGHRRRARRAGNLENSQDGPAPA